MKRILTLLALAMILGPADAFGARAPWIPGIRASEPTGISSLSIRGQFVRIVARVVGDPTYGIWTKYELEERRPVETTLSIPVYSLDDAATYSLLLNGRSILPRIEYAPPPDLEPLTTPCIESDCEMSFEEDLPPMMPVLHYDLSIPAGEHELIVYWKGRAGSRRLGQFEEWTRQVVFVFAERANGTHTVDLELILPDESVDVRTSVPLTDVEENPEVRMMTARLPAVPTSPVAVSIRRRWGPAVGACCFGGGAGFLILGLLVVVSRYRSRAR